MKTMIFMVLALGLNTAFAEEHSLHYSYKGKDFEAQVNAPSFDDAIETGALKCFKFYTSAFHLSRTEKEEELVSRCANPRRSSAQAQAFNF